MGGSRTLYPYPAFMFCERFGALFGWPHWGNWDSRSWDRGSFSVWKEGQIT